MPRQQWVCDFCCRAFDKKSAAVKHEDTCYRNPEVRGCYTCGNHDDVTRSAPGCIIDVCAVDYPRKADTGDFCPDMKRCPAWVPEGAVDGAGE